MSTEFRNWRRIWPSVNKTPRGGGKKLISIKFNNFYLPGGEPNNSPGLINILTYPQFINFQF
jgi:hypothetical protein